VIFVKELFVRDRSLRDLRLPILGENWPRKLLEDSRSAMRLLQKYRLSGTVPVKLFLHKI
jgi:hypothetical protein